jgi:hypothetical protein
MIRIERGLRSPAGYHYRVIGPDGVQVAQFRRRPDGAQSWFLTDNEGTALLEHGKPILCDDRKDMLPIVMA